LNKIVLFLKTVFFCRYAVNIETMFGIETSFEIHSYDEYLPIEREFLCSRWRWFSETSYWK